MRDGQGAIDRTLVNSSPLFKWRCAVSCAKMRALSASLPGTLSMNGLHGPPLQLILKGPCLESKGHMKTNILFWTCGFQITWGSAMYVLDKWQKPQGATASAHVWSLNPTTPCLNHFCPSQKPVTGHVLACALLRTAAALESQRPRLLLDGFRHRLHCAVPQPPAPPHSPPKGRGLAFSSRPTDMYGCDGQEPSGRLVASLPLKSPLEAIGCLFWGTPKKWQCFSFWLPLKQQKRATLKQKQPNGLRQCRPLTSRDPRSIQSLLLARLVPSARGRLDS